jgi:hypothetical protein
MTEVGV